MQDHYDFLVVGAGLFGAVVTFEATQAGKSVLVLEKRSHIGGNCYTQCDSGINVHLYGAHIFRTSDKEIWDYMSQFCEFNNFINSPIACYKDELYNLPFNMNTFYALWGAKTPEQAKAAIEMTRVPNPNPTNLEEHVLDLVGRDIYEKLVRGYTEKQWGKKCSQLPASIMRRIPLRFTYDNNYFSDPFQGIPKEGYTPIFEKMLSGAEVRTGVDFLQARNEYEQMADTVIYTGAIDAYYDYCYGPLEYRGLRFEHEKLELPNYQGVAVMNFTEAEIPYTRIIEHKHFEYGNQDFTIVSREYPCVWRPGQEPYYPMEDRENRARYDKYRALSEGQSKIRFGGRLGEYRYYDMQDTIKSALSQVKELLCK